MIVVDDDVTGGVPCVQRTRIPVGTVLAGLAEELDPATVLADFPQLVRDDVSAALVYAAVDLGGAYDDLAPQWRRMPVGQLHDQLDDKAGVMNPDRPRQVSCGSSRTSRCAPTCLRQRRRRQGKEMRSMTGDDAYPARSREAHSRVARDA